jgi:hypothetical protein
MVPFHQPQMFALSFSGFSLLALCRPFAATHSFASLRSAPLFATSLPWIAARCTVNTVL